MRLINIHTTQIKEFFGEDIPPYITLSHRWTDDEIDFADFESGRNKSSTGYEKIRNLCARAEAEGLVDFVCIDKRSSAELSEAINSMFHWYKNSVECYVFLADVHEEMHAGQNFESQSESLLRAEKTHQSILRQMRTSEWFSRGWTLPELLAPRRLQFLTSSWKPIQTIPGQYLETGLNVLYHHPTTFMQVVCAAACIPENVIDRTVPLEDVSIAQKMSWLARRKTSRIEDMAYCMLGLFGIHMPLLYGEGLHAFIRLQQELIRTSPDETIFAWSPVRSGVPWRIQQSPVLASSPIEFELCGNYETLRFHDVPRLPYQITNQGLELRLRAHTFHRLQHPDDPRQRLIVVPLNCAFARQSLYPFCLMLEEQPCGHYDRIELDGFIARAIISSQRWKDSKDTTIHVHTQSIMQACARENRQRAQHFASSSRNVMGRRVDEDRVDSIAQELARKRAVLDSLEIRQRQHGVAADSLSLLLP